MPHEPRDEEEEFSEMVVHQEERERSSPSRVQLLDPESWFVRGGVVVTIIGAVWGIAVSFTSFTNNEVRLGEQLLRLETREQKYEDKTQRDADELRKEHFEEILTLRRKVMYLRELDLWAAALRVENAGKITVPAPSDYKIDP